ncbi:hypothetical protein AVEN_82444-1 [Araneus ventricosus]|uniref:Uncharacterized protein n=1 Tax=Araneus ventricosus TaxID=182803 RepID=A0A4Y2HTC8_ARAVE|nr:hypothetical protein AVEN_82444-1 [Araneus ventricosus]
MAGLPFLISPLRVPLMTTLPTAFSPLWEQQPAEIRPTSIEVAWPDSAGLGVRELVKVAIVLGKVKSDVNVAAEELFMFANKSLELSDFRSKEAVSKNSLRPDIFNFGCWFPQMERSDNGAGSTIMQRFPKFSTSAHVYSTHVQTLKVNLKKSSLRKYLNNNRRKYITGL